MPRTPGSRLRTRVQNTALVSLGLVCLLMLSPNIAGVGADREPLEPEKFVFLLEYVTTDYANAVQEGVVVDEFEYREMQELSRLLVDHFGELLSLGASDENRVGLLELQERIHRRASPEEIQARGEALVDRLLTELEIRSLPARPPDRENGRALFGANCAPCHGALGQGDGPSSPWMDPPPGSFRDSRMEHFSHHQVFGAVSFGIDGTAMPTFRGALPDSDIWDVAFFVLSLRDGTADEPAVKAPDARRGAAPSIVAESAAESLRSDPDPRVRRWTAWTLDRSGTVRPTEIDALIAALGDRDGLVREYAASALARLGGGMAPRLGQAVMTDPIARPHAEAALIAIGAPAMPEIVRLLEQGGPVGQASAVRVLSAIGPEAEPAIPYLIDALAGARSAGSGVRPAAALGSIGSASITPLLQLLERTERPLTRELTLRALGLVGPDAKRALPLLVEALGDPNNRIRFTAASALGRIGSAAAVAALVNSLKTDPSHSVRLYAIESLGLLGPTASPAAPTLIAAFDREDDNLAGRAANALGRIGTPALRRVIEATQDPDPRVRGYAAVALSRIDVDPERKVPRLLELLHDPDEGVRDKTTSALSGLADVAVPYLIETVAADPDWRARAHALLALGRMTPRDLSVVPTLTAAIDDPNDTVGQIACWSLGTLGQSAAAALDELSAALGRSSAGVRRTSAWALGNVGPAAGSARPALEKLLHDPDPTVREEATEALRKIDGTYGPDAVPEAE